MVHYTDSLYVFGGNEYLTLLDIKNSQAKFEIKAHQTNITRLAFIKRNNDSEILISSGEDGNFILWEINNEKIIFIKKIDNTYPITDFLYVQSYDLICLALCDE